MPDNEQTPVATEVVTNEQTTEAANSEEASPSARSAETPTSEASTASGQPSVTPPTEPDASGSQPPESPGQAISVPPRLSKMSIEDLQRVYVEKVQRPTSSSNRSYLIWKIRQAQKGRISIGPPVRPASDSAPVEHKVLPIRLPADAVCSLDEVWQRHGLKSRMELFRRALHKYLVGLQEGDAAAHFTPEA